MPAELKQLQREVCTEIVIPALTSTLDTSSIAKAYVNTSAPSPPYSLEYGIPIRPFFFILSNRSISNYFDQTGG